MKSSITFKKHFFQAIPLLITALVIPFSLYMKGLNLTVLFIALGLYSLSFFPAAILHLRYFYLNKTVFLGDRKYSMTSNGKTLLTSKNEIDNIIIFMPFSAYYKKIRYFPAGSYFYGVLTLVNGDKVVITTLLDPELEWLKSLLPDKMELRVKFFCWY